MRIDLSACIFHSAGVEISKFSLNLQSLRRRRRVLLQPSNRQIQNDVLDYSDFCRTDGGGVYFLSRQDQNRCRIRAGIMVAWFPMCIGTQYVLMAKAAERLPIGTVYPVWTGIGAVGAVVVGILFLTNLLLSGESFHYNIDSIDYRTESNGLIWKGK